MSTKFNSAQNTGEEKKQMSAGREQSSLDRSSAKTDAKNDSDLNIQDLLKKYLPDYAEEVSAAPAEEVAVSIEQLAEELTEMPAEAPVSFETPAEPDPQEMAEAPVIKAEPKKKAGGLFARLRRQADEPEDAVAPDSAIFDEITDEMGGAEEMTEAFPAQKIPQEPLTAAETDAASPESNVFLAWQAAAGDEEQASAEETGDGVDEPADETAPETDTLIDETDINLMVAFGLEDQLEKKMGADAAEEATAKMDAAIREQEKQQLRAVEYEYADRSQTPQIADAYKFALGSLKIKMAIAAVLSVVLFLYENITIFGVQFAGALDPAVYPVVHIMMSLQILLLVCAVAYEQIFTGFTNLFTLRPTPESVLSVLSVFATLYSAVLAFTTEAGVEPVLYNFPVAIAALLSLIFTYFNTKREVFSFNVVSSKRPKYVFSRIEPDAGVPESQAFGATDEESPDVLRITSTGFVDGYFARTSAVLHTTRVYVGAILSAMAAAAILMAVFARIGGSASADAVTVAYLTMVAGVPLSMFFTYSYPFYKANREAYEYDSTIVGECSLDEYAGASIVSFDDKNVFPSYGVKVQNIKIYNNNRIDRVLYYAASAFSATGGPLADVFELATVETGHSDQVEIVSAGSGHLETVIDGRRILFGRSAVLTELGYDIPVETVEEDSYVQGDLSILYMLRDGELVAKMYVRYVMDADFEFILRQFARGGTCVCVKTLDPNIDEEMIFSKVRGRKYPLKIVRNMDGCESVEHADSGIVTRGTTKSLLQVVSYCDMVLSVKNTNMIISIVSAIVSLAILLIVTMSKNLGALHSWMIVANQIFWMIPAMLTTKLFIK